MVFNTSLKSRLRLLNTKIIIRGVEISGLFSPSSKHTLPPFCLPTANKKDKLDQVESNIITLSHYQYFRPTH